MESMDLKNERNLSMLVDFYELTMSNGYYENGYADSVEKPCNDAVYCEKLPGKDFTG